MSDTKWNNFKWLINLCICWICGLFAAYVAIVWGLIAGFVFGIGLGVISAEAKDEDPIPSINACTCICISWVCVLVAAHISVLLSAFLGILLPTAFWKFSSTE